MDTWTHSSFIPPATSGSNRSTRLPSALGSCKHAFASAVFAARTCTTTSCGFGTVRVKEPIVLGHEIAGTIEAVGSGVQGFAVGERVAISPSRPCGRCRYCQQGLQNHCLDMR